MTAAHVEALARWGETADGARRTRGDRRARLQPRARAHAGPHRRARRRRPRRDARRDRDARRPPSAINPLVPVDLVIDHSVIIEHCGTAASFGENVDDRVRAQRSSATSSSSGRRARSSNFRVVPPGTGICHQVNLEYLSRVVFERDGAAFPDTLVGIDSHTTMVNGLGVLGWGVGGIEAEAAMLGQPIPMLVPPVVGLRLTGRTPEGVTATDVVLTITELLRRHGVVGKFVEAFGPGVASLSLETRATIGNMSPGVRLDVHDLPDRPGHARLPRASRAAPTRRSSSSRPTRVARGCGTTPSAPEPAFSEVVELDLSTRRAVARRTVAAPGPRHAHRAARRGARRRSAASRASVAATGVTTVAARRRRRDRRDHELHQHVEPLGHGRRRARRASGPSSAGSRPSPG